jgi:hypothetical protein
VLTMPATSLMPSTLPRVAMLHPVEAPEVLAAALRPWRHQLSSLGGESPWLAGVRPWFPRWCPLGELQRPRMPRLHDGVAMLGCVVEAL